MGRVTTPTEIARPRRLTFSEKAHRYTLDGRTVPSVTSLIGDGYPKPALPRWSARTVAEYAVANLDQIADMRARGGVGPTVDYLRGVPWQQARTAALRGTDIHALGERLVHGETVDVPDAYRGHVDGYVRWLDIWQPTPLFSERPLASRRWWFAGKPDLVAEMAGVTWLLDMKTSAKGVYGDAGLQLAAYAGAEFYVADSPTYVEEPMPRCERLGVLWVTDTDTVLREVVDPAAAWKDFLHVAWVARAKTRIDHYLSEPLSPGQEAVA